MEPALVPVQNGSTLIDVPASWLRLHCPCGQCSIVEVGERRVLLTDPGEWTVASVTQLDGETMVQWHSGHTSRFPQSFVAAMDNKANRRRWTPELWDGSSFPAEVDHDEFMANESSRRDALLAYRARGLLIVRDVPTVGEPTEDFLDALNVPIWEGPFALRSIDTRVRADAVNVSETAETLPPHTDLAGYQWPPSGQILHLLVNETSGGSSLAVDGWRILQELRADESDLFDVLCDVPVGHRLYSEERETWARAPLIRLDRDNQVTGIRYSNQTLQPLPLDEPRLHEWHTAYAELTRRVTDPTNATTFQLATGDAYLTHGHRVLHGRTAFDSTGERCLRDCYFEFDNVLGILDQLTGEVDPHELI